MEALPKCVFSPSSRASNLPFLKRQCQAGRTVIAVSPTGEIRPCSHNPVSYGNLMTEGLDDIWVKMIDWRDDRYIPNKCHGCSVVDECLGGCRINALASSGRLNGDDPWRIGEVKQIVVPRKEVVLSDKTRLGVPKHFRWRIESDGTYIVCGKSPRTATCLLYTSPSPRDGLLSRMPSSA